MARTRQKRKAKQRQQQQQQQQATRRDATAKQQPMNPAEQAAIQTADALEAADELEEIVAEESPVPGVMPEESPVPGVMPEPPRPEPKPRRTAVERKEPRRERKPAPEKKKEPRQRNRVVNFLIQVWAELRRVQWPDRNQVTQATGVVIVFCFLAGAFLAFWDWVFGEIVTSIL
jgi:preprotein translocase SecE subunit